MGYGTRELEERAARYPTVFSMLGTVAQGRMVPSPGGVRIAGSDGDVMGAVGTSGDADRNDELCAIAGIEAAGFRAVPGRRGS